VGERALHEPALGAESATVLGVAPGYQRFHAEVPNQLAVLVVAYPRSASTTSGRRLG
jgi:hypothetical protein